MPMNSSSIENLPGHPGPIPNRRVWAAGNSGKCTNDWVEQLFMLEENHEKVGGEPQRHYLANWLCPYL